MILYAKDYIIIGMALIIVILYIVQLILTNELSSQGKKIAEINKELDRVELENELLKKEIAGFASLSRTAENAKRLHLFKPTKFMYINDTDRERRVN